MNVQDTETKTMHYCYCDSCGAVGPYADTVEGAIEKWNTRPGAVAGPEARPSTNGGLDE